MALIITFSFQVPSHVMLGIPKHEEAPPTPPHPLSPMGDACSRMDLTAIHQILVTTHYKDDEGTNEVIWVWHYGPAHFNLEKDKLTSFYQMVSCPSKNGLNK